MAEYYEILSAEKDPACKYGIDTLIRVSIKKRNWFTWTYEEKEFSGCSLGGWRDTSTGSPIESRELAKKLKNYTFVLERTLRLEEANRTNSVPVRKE